MQDDAPSKSQKKAAMRELQSIGAALVDLSDAQLATIRMPPELAAAVLEARRITAREARRRQLQYIGRVMREVDPVPLRTQLAALSGGSAASAARQKRLEQWRARLIEDEAALTEFLGAHPGADAQALRTAIRNARKEAAEQRPPRAFRELFRLVREAEDARP